MSVIRKNRSYSNDQCHFTLIVGFKWEWTHDWDGYNLAIRPVNLFDVLNLIFSVFNLTNEAVMLNLNIIADIIAYYSKVSMTEVFFSNIAVFYLVKLLRNGTPSWISSWKLNKIFRNNFGLDQLCKQVLLKESCATIYHLLGTGKLLRKLFPRKLYALSFKWFLWNFYSWTPLSPHFKSWRRGLSFQSFAK